MTRKRCSKRLIARQGDSSFVFLLFIGFLTKNKINFLYIYNESYRQDFSIPKKDDPLNLTRF